MTKAKKGSQTPQPAMIPYKPNGFRWDLNSVVGPDKSGEGRIAYGYIQFQTETATLGVFMSSEELDYYIECLQDINKGVKKSEEKLLLDRAKDELVQAAQKEQEAKVFSEEGVRDRLGTSVAYLPPLSPDAEAAQGPQGAEG